jgi:transcription elongation GreA/GreB family factor
MKHEIYLLPEDRQYAEARIIELEQMIQNLGPDFNDAFTQSSETWHDNSPFEAVRDKQSMYAAELHKLRTLVRTSTLTPPKKKRGTIGVDSEVTLDNGKIYKIAGDWTHKAGQHADGVIWVSCHTPVAITLLGKRCSDHIQIGTTFTLITNIE